MARSTTSFAQLLGLGKRARGAKADDSDGPVVDDYNNDDPEDEQYAEDEDDKPSGKRAKRAKRAEDDDDKPDAEDDGDDADAEDDDEKPAAKARGKRAKRAEEGDDKPDAEDDDDEKPSASAARERARCAKIMAYGMNHGMAEQAFVMAFDSSMSKTTAINVLKASKAVAPQRQANGSFGSAMSQLGVTHVAPAGGAREQLSGDDATAALISKHVQ